MTQEVSRNVDELAETLRVLREAREDKKTEAKTRPRPRRALKAEIDEAAWASLYTTKSRPFPLPSTGKTAVKVINHYGDEVLKVYEVEASTH